jgi:ankyrin repeat protein
VDDIACQGGRDTCISLLLDSGINVNDDRYTPLTICCIMDHATCVTLCLDRGAQINLTDKFGQSAAHWACKTGSVRSLQVLINCGADMNIKNFDGDAPLDYAQTYKHPECGDLLRSMGATSRDQV